MTHREDGMASEHVPWSLFFGMFCFSVLRS